MNSCDSNEYSLLYLSPLIRDPNFLILSSSCFLCFCLSLCFCIYLYFIFRAYLSLSLSLFLTLSVSLSVSLSLSLSLSFMLSLSPLFSLLSCSHSFSFHSDSLLACLSLIHSTIFLLPSTSSLKVMVFLPTARQTGYLAAIFNSLGIEVMEIHSRKSQVRVIKMGL